MVWIKRSVKGVCAALIAAALLVPGGCGRKVGNNAVTGGEEISKTQTEQNETTSDAGRETVILCTSAYGVTLKKLVSDYNQESKQYEIVVQTLGENEDVQTFRTRVQAELTAGKGADLLDVYALQNLDYVPYARSGMLLELSEMQKEFGEIPDKVLACNRYEEGIYGLPMAFYLQGLVYVRDLEVRGEEWDAEKCMQTLEESGILFFNACPKRMDAAQVGCYLLNLLGVGKDNIQLFVEKEKGTCSFDGPEFQRVLAFAKEHMDTGARDLDESERLQNGDVLFSDSQFGSFRSFWEISQKCGGKEKYIGYPCPNGEVYGIHARGFYVNAGTKHLDGVKDFLKYLLSDQVQESFAYSADGYFPARSDILQKQWEQAEKEILDTGYATDMSGKIQYQPRLMTKEEERLFWHMLDSSVPFYYQNVIDDIVWEEAGPYFMGEKDAKTVSAAIQGRVQNYLNEESK